MLPKTSELLAKRKPCRIVLYGDSISEVGRTPAFHGGASCAELNWGARLEAMLREETGNQEISVAHFGIGGQNAYEGLGRLDWLEPMRADLVLIEFGANDCVYHPLPPEATALAVGFLIDGIRARYGADTVVIGFGGDNPRQPVLNHLDETLDGLRGVAHEKSALYVDIRPAIIAATDEGANWVGWHNGSSDCHPNDRGHDLWAQTVFATLITQLKPALRHPGAIIEPTE